MLTYNPKQLREPEIIREINPTVLCAFLKPFEGYLRTRGLEVREPSRIDNATIEKLVDILGTSDQALSSACLRFFGSHDAAFEAAGIESPARRWTKERIIAAIQDCFIAAKVSDRIGFGDEKLASAAYRHFGSWPAAVEAAGLIDKVPIKPTLRRWNKQSVIAEIRAWHDSGHRLAEVSTKYQALFNAAKTHFGGWNNAIMAADLEPERRFYTKAEILDMIRRKHEAANRSAAGIRKTATWRC